MLAKHHVAVDLDIKLTHRAWLELGDDVLFSFDHLRETRGAWFVVSLHAILDDDFHGSKTSTTQVVRTSGRSMTRIVAGVYRVFGLGCMSALLTVAGCGSKAEDERPGAPETTASVSPVVGPLPFPTSGTWQAARSMDGLLLAELAEAEGTSGLLPLASAPGPARLVAIRALAYAPDAESALGPLAKMAAGKLEDEAERSAALETISEIAGRPQAPTELADPQGAKACAGAMLLLHRRSDLTASQRATARTALHRLARKGYLDASQVGE